MRISEALALETKHFINGGRTIVVEQQVEKDCPRIKKKLKTDASYRQIDLHPDVAEYLRKFVSGKSGLILQTNNGTPYLYGNLAEDWLDPETREARAIRGRNGLAQLQAVPKFLATGTSPEVPRRPAEVLARTQAEGDG